ncbi:MAG: hypothetical protein ACI8RD_008219, partial [Bacillariaceae sp.]
WFDSLIAFFLVTGSIKILLLLTHHIELSLEPINSAILFAFVLCDASTLLRNSFSVVHNSIFRNSDSDQSACKVQAAEFIDNRIRVTNQILFSVHSAKFARVSRVV